MKRRSVAVLLALLGCGTLFADDERPSIPEKYQVNGYKEFESLSSADATAKGEALAKADFKTGLYRLFVFGLRTMKETPDETKLREGHAIYFVPIAGCIVSDGILGAADGYNRTMKPLLEAKFGKTIFENIFDGTKGNTATKENP